MQTDPISAATAYRQALEHIVAAKSLHGAVRRATDVLKLVTFAPPSEEQISISSGYGGNTHRPFVTLATTTPAIQMDTATARSIAQQLLEAAQSAESDEFLFVFAMEQIGLDQ